MQFYLFNIIKFKNDFNGYLPVIKTVYMLNKILKHYNVLYIYFYKTLELSQIDYIYYNTLSIIPEMNEIIDINFFGDFFGLHKLINKIFSPLNFICIYNNTKFDKIYQDTIFINKFNA